MQYSVYIILVILIIYTLYFHSTFNSLFFPKLFLTCTKYVYFILLLFFTLSFGYKQNQPHALINYYYNKERGCFYIYVFQRHGKSHNYIHVHYMHVDRITHMINGLVACRPTRHFTII